jgi:serine phosphatase RsbU (regulator of sigma subunit)
LLSRDPSLFHTLRISFAAGMDAGIPALASDATTDGRGPGMGGTRAEGAVPADELPSASLASVGRSWPLSRTAALALVVGLVVTAAFALTSLALYNRNETRLLNLRVRELGSVLSAAVTSIQTPLASAAELADATGGSPQKFRAFMAPYVGPGRQFASASLWPLTGAHPTPTTVTGATPVLLSLPGQTQRFFSRARRQTLLSVTGLLESATPKLGYEYSIPGAKRGFAAYAESPLPKDRRSAIASSSAFSDLNYVLYLGRTRRTEDLLVTSLRHLPATGRQASDVVPFGDDDFTLVATPKGSLGGTFFESLPWIIAVVGVLLSLAAALMTDRLARRRQHAEDLARDLDRVATENREMYAEQRSIAETLQHALLPDELPELAGLQVSALYVPAASGIDVGGDWYDIVAAGQGQVFVMIGDVSGHGLRAATTMASLRHAALAYAAQDYSPAAVLSKLSDFVNSTAHDYFATMLCALIDVPAHRLTISSAGHLAPLLVDHEQTRFVEFDVNVPIGVRRASPYGEATISVNPDTTLIAFTDGLVERRGETLDTGLARLRDAAGARGLALSELLSELTRELSSDDHHDDTAIVGVRWQN